MRSLLVALALLAVPALVMTDGPPQAKDKDKDIGKTFAVPTRLTDTGHFLVRAKINGKGPFNFIVDTGAPLVYISVPVAKKLGIEPAKKGLSTIDNFQIEGGPVHAQLKCMIETPFQLEGMNALGLPGVELHGIIGYSLLAHYKLQIDPTSDVMKWTKLDFKPPLPESLGAKDDALAGLNGMASMMKGLAKLLGNKGAAEPALRGFIGVELAEKNNGVVVQSVLSGGPAAQAGLKAGDRLLSVLGTDVATSAEVREALARVTPGQAVAFVISRDNTKQTILITAVEGI